MLILLLENASIFALFYHQSKEPNHLRICAVSMKYFTQLFMQPAWHMVYWRMTMNGDNAFKKLLTWQVVINCVISLSQSCVTVYHLTLWLCGWNFESTYVMIFDMHFIPKTSSLTPPKSKCLTMAFTSLINFSMLETSHFEIGQPCLCHKVIVLQQLGTGSLQNNAHMTMMSRMNWLFNASQHSTIGNMLLLMLLSMQSTPSLDKPSFCMVLEELAKPMFTTPYATISEVRAKLWSVWLHQA